MGPGFIELSYRIVQPTFRNHYKLKSEKHFSPLWFSPDKWGSGPPESLINMNIYKHITPGKFQLR